MVATLPVRDDVHSWGRALFGLFHVLYVRTSNASSTVSFFDRFHTNDEFVGFTARIMEYAYANLFRSNISREKAVVFMCRMCLVASHIIFDSTRKASGRVT